jgi:hypothetical protein
MTGCHRNHPLTYDKEINLRGGCPLWSFATDALGARFARCPEYPESRHEARAQYMTRGANSRHQREEIRSGNFNGRAARPRDNALAIAADIRPPLILRSYTIPEPSLVPAGDCAVAPPSRDHLGEIRR